MKIAVVGAANIGGTLASKLAGAGNDVTVGVRSPEGRQVEGARPGSRSRSSATSACAPWFALMTERGGNRRLGFKALGL